MNADALCYVRRTGLARRGIMADLSTIRAQLAGLRQRIQASPVFVAGRPDSADKATEEANRLELIANTIQIIVRDLNSNEHLLRARESQLRSVPHQHRYSAEQSLKQLAENVRALRNGAQALAELVRELLDRNGLLNPIQKAKDIIDLGGELDRIAGHEAHVLVAQTLRASKQATLGPDSLGGR